MLQTKRLTLRAWRDDDVENYAALHADPHVAYWLGGRLSPEEAEERLRTMRAGLEERGWGMWAVERTEDGSWLGTVGLDPVREDLPVHPAIEASWRMAPSYWGRGYATEAMRAVLADAVARGETEIVSFTAATNTRSQAVMTRLGFKRDASSDFDHPRLPQGHTLRRHVVYRLIQA